MALFWRPDLEPEKTFSPALKALPQVLVGFPADARTCRGCGSVSLLSSFHIINILNVSYTIKYQYVKTSFHPRWFK